MGLNRITNKFLHISVFFILTLLSPTSQGFLSKNLGNEVVLSRLLPLENSVGRDDCNTVLFQTAK